MSESCRPHHDWVAGLLTAFLNCGLVVSYVPQHYRIINKKSSEGFSPWFLLFGSTASASAMMNMVALQWGIIKCCNVLSFGNCVEMTAGVFMIALQWFLFTAIAVLYIIYYPPHLKYGEHDIDNHDLRPPQPIKAQIRTHNWTLSLALAFVTLLHLVIVVSTTFFFVLTDRPVAGWATFLGVSGAALTAIQYLPQLVHTFRIKLVGALSIVMMVMQSPGSAIFVISIALRPGTNWTSWIMYAVSGIMQAILLGMCIAWKFRQNRLGIDDFGHPLLSGHEEEVVVEVEDALDDDVRESGVAVAGEETPLLVNGKTKAADKGRKGWMKWMKRR